MNILLSESREIKKTATTEKSVVCGRIRATKNRFCPMVRGRSKTIASRSSDWCVSDIPAVSRSLPSFPVTDFHPKREPLTLTAAVPSGTFTRLSILSRCYTQPGTLAMGINLLILYKVHPYLSTVNRYSSMWKCLTRISVWFRQRWMM